MKNVTGGVMHYCTLVCKVTIQIPTEGNNWQGQYQISSSYVAGCTPDYYAACMGAEIVSCTCGVM